MPEQLASNSSLVLSYLSIFPDDLQQSPFLLFLISKQSLPLPPPLEALFSPSPPSGRSGPLFSLLLWESFSRTVVLFFDNASLCSQASFYWVKLSPHFFFFFFSFGDIFLPSIDPFRQRLIRWPLFSCIEYSIVPFPSPVKWGLVSSPFFSTKQIGISQRVNSVSQVEPFQFFFSFFSSFFFFLSQVTKDLSTLLYEFPRNDVSPWKSFLYKECNLELITASRCHEGANPKKIRSATTPPGNLRRPKRTYFS